MALAKFICLGVFALEVENIDGKLDVIKEFVPLNTSCQGAIVIEKNMPGLGVGNTIDLFNQGLDHIVQRQL